MYTQLPLELTVYNLESAMSQPSSQQLFLHNSSPTYLEHAQKPHFKTEYNSRVPTSICSSALCLRDGHVDQVVFLTETTERCYKRVVNLEHPASLHPDNFNTILPVPDSAPTSHPRTDSLVPVGSAEHAKDDTTVQNQPTRYVDYLSHDWEEEDIWSSWKNIDSNRKAYDNSARLTNALWRTWMKSKYRLKTASAEALDWLKDSDVTWLYGPLQTSPKKFPTASLSQTGSGTSEWNLFLHKKPILKKRSVLDIILQQPPCSSTPLKPAAAALAAQAQQNHAPALLEESSQHRIGIAILDNIAFLLSLRPFSGDKGSGFSSISLPEESSTPMNARRHIHFNDKVEQCIAVDIEDGDNGENRGEDYSIYGNDGLSDDELNMKTSSKLRIPSRSMRSSSSSSFITASLSIAMLPPTILKH